MYSIILLLSTYILFVVFSVTTAKGIPCGKNILYFISRSLLPAQFFMFLNVKLYRPLVNKSRIHLHLITSLVLCLALVASQAKILGTPMTAALKKHTQ